MNGMTFLRGIGLPLLLSALLGACASGQQGVRDDAPAVPATVPAAEASAPDATPAIASTEAAPLGSDGASTDAIAATDSSGAAPSTAPTDAPTQAEQDYAALYGAGDAYNPVADPTLPTPAQLPTSYDPWEPMNRRVHTFNNAVDRVVAKPLAKAYVAVVPRPVRLGVGNFFNNLGQPVSAVNALLQGKPKQAGQSLARFLVNSTIGVAGLFDPATRFNIPNKSEDFGQTLGVWGWKTSRYLELPLFGPRTVRDTFGLIGDAPMAPLQYVEEDKLRVFAQGLQLVDVRTQLMSVDSMREGAADDYALVRDAWTQRRNYQINGDSRRQDTDGEQLPDYLQDDGEDNPTVPVDVMPYVPGAPGG